MERVWIYQASRPFTASEEEIVLDKLEEFTVQWKAHGKQLAAYVEIKYNLFVVITVDQSFAMPSGCSIDKSVHLLKELEEELGISLFDRFQIAYREGNQVHTVPRKAFEELIDSGKVTEDTIVFNNLVEKRDDLASKWEVPFRESWHARVFS